MNLNPHEAAFIESFVKDERKERAALMLSNAKKRKKFVQEFAHHGTYILRPECLKSIEPSQRNAESLHAMLRHLGAPDTCYVISEGDLDGKEVNLLAALKETIGRGIGTVISCIPGRLGYFEGELRERFILQRSP